jgi:hypothetical protein
LRQFNDYQTRLNREGLSHQLSPETLVLREAIVVGASLPVIPKPESLPFLHSPNDHTPALTLAEQADIEHPADKEHPEGKAYPRRWAGGVGLRRWFPQLVAITLILLAVIVLGVFVVLPLTHPRGSLKTLTLTGPQFVQDTWILSTLPDTVSAGDLDEWWLYIDLDDGRGLINPRVPFARYPAARLNLASGAVEDALLHFDLGELPPGSYVESVLLTSHLMLDHTWVGKTRLPPVTIAAYRLLRAWDPATVTFSFPWVEPGLRPEVDYDPQPLSRQTISSVDPITFDLTAAFPAWQRGRNFGVILRVIEAPAGESPYWMITTEHPNSSLWPILVIQYR